MGNYVIEVGNYVIVNPSELGNYVIADSRQLGPSIKALTAGNAGPGPCQPNDHPDSSQGEADRQARAPRPDPDARTCPDQPHLRASSGPDRRDRSSA
jgi:hypothetical protein